MKHIIYNPQGNTEGHSQQYATNICNGLIENELEVIMITSQDFNDADIQKKEKLDIVHTAIKNTREVKKNDKNIFGRLFYGFTVIKNNFNSFKTLTKICSDNQESYCSIIGGDTLSNLIYIYTLPKERKKRISLTIHNADYDLNLYRKDVVRYVFKYLSKMLLLKVIHSDVLIFTHGEAMQNELANQLNCENSRISFYRVPAEIKSIKASDRENKNLLVLSFIGVIRFDKGLDILCKALSFINNDINNWRLKISGSSAQVGHQYVHEIIEKHGLSSYVDINLKYLSDEELEDEIVNSDIVILPYRKTFLAKSVVMSDSVRLKTPVIATEESQNGYDASKFKVGVTFESENIEQLSKAIIETINKVNDNYSWGFESYIEAHLPRMVAAQIIYSFKKYNGKK
jgi:glycosyltransferase involved in cell wall biosynthesis